MIRSTLANHLGVVAGFAPLKPADFDLVQIQHSYTITQAYYDTAMQDAKARIALAVARLAKLLNENLH